MRSFTPSPFGKGRIEEGFSRSFNAQVVSNTIQIFFETEFGKEYFVSYFLF
jgi:hypothetical protein